MPGRRYVLLRQALCALEMFHDYVSGRLAPGTKWQNEATSSGLHARSVRDARLSLMNKHTGVELCDYVLVESDGVLRRLKDPTHQNLPGSVCADGERGDDQNARQSTERSKLAHRPILLQECWLEERGSEWGRTSKPITALGGTANSMRPEASATLQKGRRDSDSKRDWGKTVQELAKQRDALLRQTRPPPKRTDGTEIVSTQISETALRQELMRDHDVVSKLVLRRIEEQTKVLHASRRRASLENSICVSRKGPDSKSELDAHGLVFTNEATTFMPERHGATCGCSRCQHAKQVIGKHIKSIMENVDP